MKIIFLKTVMGCSFAWIRLNFTHNPISPLKFHVTPENDKSCTLYQKYCTQIVH